MYLNCKNWQIVKKLLAKVYVLNGNTELLKKASDTIITIIGIEREIAEDIDILGTRF